MASLKLCLDVGGRKQIRRSRVESLTDFTFSALRKIVADTFPDLSGKEELGYEDDEGELVTLTNDADLAECVSCMEVGSKKTLRIEILGIQVAPKVEKVAIDTSTL